MVYCNYISNTNNTVSYKFGGHPDDVSGEFVFDFVNSTLDIIKEPKKEMAPIRHIHRLLRLHQNQFRSGCFKEKISYES